MRHMLMEIWSSVDEDWNFHQQVRGPSAKGVPTAYIKHSFKTCSGHALSRGQRMQKKIRSSNMSLPLSGVLQRFRKKITPTAAIPIPNLFSWSQG